MYLLRKRQVVSEKFVLRDLMRSWETGGKAEVQLVLER